MLLLFRSPHSQGAAELRPYLERRLHFALSRFGDHVERVIATLDRFGSRRRSDSSCSLTIHLGHGGLVRVDERAPDAYVAIDRAAGRAARLVKRELDRRRQGIIGRETVRAA